MRRVILFCICFCLFATKSVASEVETQQVFRLAADGDAVAQTTLASWYFEGVNGVKQDYETALKWWAAAAKQGNAKAIEKMAMCYRYGYAVQQDSAKAVSLYMNALKKGNSDFLPASPQDEEVTAFDAVVAAIAYRNGMGVKRNPELAIEFFERAAILGSVDAMREGALLCLNTKNEGRALQLFDRGTEMGDVNCTYFSGMLRLDGKGTQQDTVRGVELISQASVAKFPQATYHLYKLRRDGKYVPQDSTMAFLYLRRAAAEGSHLAQWDYAEALRDGSYCKRQYFLALQWMAVTVSNSKSASFKKQYCNLEQPDTTLFGVYLKAMSNLRLKHYDKVIDYANLLLAEGACEGVALKAQAIIRQADDNGKVAEVVDSCLNMLLKAAACDDAAKYETLELITKYAEYLPADSCDNAFKFLDEACNDEFPLAYAAKGCMLYYIEKYDEACEWFSRLLRSGLMTKSVANLYVESLSKLNNPDPDLLAAANAAVEKSLPDDFLLSALDLYASSWSLK